jgi:putative transposase
MVEPAHPKISVSRQCQLLALPRSTRYHQPKPVREKTLLLMQQIDELYMQHPFYGARQMARALKRLGHEVGRRRAGRLMRVMGLVRDTFCTYYGCGTAYTTSYRIIESGLRDIRVQQNMSR